MDPVDIISCSIGHDFLTLWVHDSTWDFSKWGKKSFWRILDHKNGPWKYTRYDWSTILHECQKYHIEKIYSKEILLFPKVIFRDSALITYYDWPTTSLRQILIHKDFVCSLESQWDPMKLQQGYAFIVCSQSKIEGCKYFVSAIIDVETLSRD